MAIVLCVLFIASTMISFEVGSPKGPSSSSGVHTLSGAACDTTISAVTTSWVNATSSMTIHWNVTPADSPLDTELVRINIETNGTVRQDNVSGGGAESAAFSGLQNGTVYDFTIWIPTDPSCDDAQYDYEQGVNYMGSFFTGDSVYSPQLCPLGSLSLSDFQFKVTPNDLGVSIEWTVQPATVDTTQGSIQDNLGGGDEVYLPVQTFTISGYGVDDSSYDNPSLVPSENPTTGRTVVNFMINLTGMAGGGMTPGDSYQIQVEADGGWGPNSDCYTSATWPTAGSEWELPSAAANGKGYVTPPAGTIWAYMMVNGTLSRGTWVNSTDDTGWGHSTGDPIYGGVVSVYDSHLGVWLNTTQTNTSGAYYWKLYDGQLLGTPNQGVVMDSGPFYDLCPAAPGYQTPLPAASSLAGPLGYPCVPTKFVQGVANTMQDTNLTFTQYSGSGPGVIGGNTPGDGPLWDIDGCYNASTQYTCSGSPSPSVLVQPTTYASTVTPYPEPDVDVNYGAASVVNLSGGGPQGLPQVPGCPSTPSYCPALELTIGLNGQPGPASASVRLANVDWAGYAGLPLSGPTELKYYVYDPYQTGFGAGSCLPVAMDLEFTNPLTHAVSFMSQVNVTSPLPDSHPGPIIDGAGTPISAADQCPTYSGPNSYTGLNGSSDSWQQGWWPVTVDLTGLTNENISSVWLVYDNTSLGQIGGTFQVYFADAQIVTAEDPTSVVDGSFNNGLAGWFDVGSIQPNWMQLDQGFGLQTPLYAANGDTDGSLGKGAVEVGVTTSNFATSPSGYSGVSQYLEVPDGLSPYGTPGGMSLCFSFAFYTTDGLLGGNNSHSLDYQELFIYDFDTGSYVYLAGGPQSVAISTTNTDPHGSGEYPLLDQMEPLQCIDVSQLEGDHIVLELVVYQSSYWAGLYQQEANNGGNPPIPVNEAYLAGVDLIPTALTFPGGSSLATTGDFWATSPSNLPLLTYSQYGLGNSNAVQAYGYSYVNMQTLSAFSQYPGAMWLVPYSIANQTYDGIGDSLTAGLRLMSFTSSPGNGSDESLELSGSATATAGQFWPQITNSESAIPCTIPGLEYYQALLKGIQGSAPGVGCNYIQDISVGMGFFCITSNYCGNTAGGNWAAGSTYVEGGVQGGSAFLGSTPSSSIDWSGVDQNLIDAGEGVARLAGTATLDFFAPEFGGFATAIEYASFGADALDGGFLGYDGAQIYSDIHPTGAPLSWSDCGQLFSIPKISGGYYCPGYMALSPLSNGNYAGGVSVGDVSVDDSLNLPVASWYGGTQNQFMIVVIVEADIGTFTISSSGVLGGSGQSPTSQLNSVEVLQLTTP
jgi:hypothetical protein